MKTKIIAASSAISLCITLSSLSVYAQGDATWQMPDEVIHHTPAT